MIKNHLAEKIEQKLGHTSTPSQHKLIGELSEFVANNTSNNLFLIKGYAGTGKTTVISAMVKTFDEYGIKSVLLAPTGRAAKILNQFSGKPAYTIHKKIYRQKSSKDGFGRFALDNNLHTNTFFIVDEASMISNQSNEIAIFGTGRLLDDLVQYVYNNNNCKLILIGDTAQLPPVGLAISPALNKNFLETYLLNVHECEITDVVRQEKASGILENATGLRRSIKLNKENLPKFCVSGFSDIVRVTGTELAEKIGDAYNQYGIEQTIVINRSNKRANQYNAGIRNNIFSWEEEIVKGELLMVVKNNYFWLQENEKVDFIANGDIIEILKIKKYYDIFGYRFAEVTVRMIDYNIEIETKLLLDTLSVDTASLTSEQNRNLFYTIYNDYSHIKPKKKGYDMVKNNPFFNALQVKFAYSVTCHKAQGGQWKVVFIDQGYINENMVNTEYLRWLYTALTRSTCKVYLVNFPDKYFG